MPNRSLRGFSEKQIFRNEKFNRGIIATNDPLREGSFRRLINFKISNQGTSLENRDPFLTVPLLDLRNKEIKLSENSIAFALHTDTEHAYILDMQQTLKTSDQYKAIFLKKDIQMNPDNGLVLDGDTFDYEYQRYRLAFIDTPELDDETYDPFDTSFTTMGEESKFETEMFLKNSTFSIIQFPFQSEKEDQFGRKIVFVIKKVEGEYVFLNGELLRKGIAYFFNVNSFNKKNVTFYLPQTVEIEEETFQFFNYFNTCYNNPENLINILKVAYSTKYTDITVRLDMYKNEDVEIYSKPKVYKIKKETDLKQNEDGVILKRVLKTFEINENEVKKDLEISADTNLKYGLINKEFSIINGKYQNQHFNFHVNVWDQFKINLYRGLIDLYHNPADHDNGIEETFFLKTYKSPEAHIELQDIANTKPNIYSDRSFIPERIIGLQANVKGYKNPSVNAVLLNTKINEKLERTNELDTIKITKFFQTDRPVYEDLKNYFLSPFFKAPKLLSTKKNQYMFRWDFVNMAEIDTTNEEELKNANPIYRTAWTNLVFNPNNESHNISQNEKRKKIIATKLSNIKKADEFYILKSTLTKTTIGETDELIIENLYDDSQASNTTRRKIQEVQDLFEDYIKDSQVSLEDIITQITRTDVDPHWHFRFQIPNPGESFGKEYFMFKAKNKKQVLNNLLKNEEEDNFFYEQEEGEESKILTYEEVRKIFGEEYKNKKIAFIFCPINVYFSKDKIKINYAWKTQGFVLNFEEDRKKVVPYNIEFSKLKNYLNEEDFDFDNFFKDGIQATFYLYNYESVEKLDQEDPFYDILAYKKSSPTYSFRKGSAFKYKKEDFIDDTLDKESFAVKYSKYITAFEDRIIVYGNQEYKNTVFISEEGAPYYFTLSKTFEFDHEVVHVQAFKTILMVFTINDIWVIYRTEEQNEFGEILVTWRYKKILYNVSTEFENKSTIKNITRYVTLMSNNVLYLIRPSTYIGDDTEFSLTILSQNIDSIVKDPLSFINERLKYYNIFQNVEDYEMNLNATDNNIKIYYSAKTSESVPYTLILTYDILNNRWYEEDTISFGKPEQIYLLDASTKYEMLTKNNNQLFITYQTDKYKNMMLNEFNESYYDRSYFQNYPIQYFIDTGYLKISDHLRKRFKYLQINIKNIDSKKILFTYNFTIDDKQFENNFEPIFTINSSNEYAEIEKLKEFSIDVESLKQLELEITSALIKKGDTILLDELKTKLILNKEIDLKLRDALISDIGTLDNFLLDFSNLEIGDIMTVKQNLLGKGRLPRVQMGFSTMNRFYILAFGLVYSEQGGN